MGGRPSGISASKSPGPGTYDVDRSINHMKESRSQVGFGSSTKPSLHSNSKSMMSPGPGTYDTSEKAVKSKNPSYNFGKTTSRAVERGDASVDFYSPGKAFGEGAPKVTMGGRP